MEQQKAMDFFSELYGGEHHVPNYKVYPFGYGWLVKHDRGDIATYDFNFLTKLVLLAHEKCYRVSIAPLNFSTIKICVWERQREGGMSERHPTIEQAIETFNKNKLVQS